MAYPGIIKLLHLYRQEKVMNIRRLIIFYYTFLKQAAIAYWSLQTGTTGHTCQDNLAEISRKYAAKVKSKLF